MKRWIYGLLLTLLSAKALTGPAGRAAPRRLLPPARPVATAKDSADEQAAETALTALAAGRLPQAYAALEPLTTVTSAAQASGSLLRWSSRLAQTRLLSQLGARLAAQAALPAPLPHGGHAPPWAEAAWLLTRADLARTAGQPQAALVAARRARHLLTRLTPPGHPARAQAWLQLGVAQLLSLQPDSALYAASQARAALALSRTTGQAARWLQAPVAERLALPTPSALLVDNLLSAALGQRRAPGPVQVGALVFRSRAAAVEAFLDSAVRAGERRGSDSTQLAVAWNLRAVSWAERALRIEVEADAAAAAQADAGFQRATSLARTPAERAAIETSWGEFRSGYYGPAAALPVYERALTDLTGQPATRAASSDSLGAAPDQDALLYLLEQQAVAYRDLYAETAEPRLLDAFVARASQLADVLAHRREQTRLGYAAATPGLDAATVADNYALGVEAAEARYRARGRAADLATAFRIAQTAKAWRLLTRVGGEQAVASQRADERSLRRYRRTTARLRRWEEIEALTAAYPALARRPAFSVAPDSTRAARAALVALTAALRQQYPALYARAFNGTYALSLADAERSLPADGRTAAIEFLRRTGSEDGTNGEWVYAFVIQPTGTRLLRLPLPVSVSGLIDSLVETLARPGSPAYPRLAARAYALVLAPAASVLAPGVRHLIIAPDGELWRLPFEALLTRRPPTGSGTIDYRRLPYALRRWSFTYAHSLTLRARAREAAGPADPPARLLALAPFSAAGGEHALPFSGKLLTELARTTAGDFWVGSAASRGALRRGAADAGVFHLATHATTDQADPTTSALQLADGRLSLAELFNLPLHPRLVVLSACETGVGPIRGPSESVTSLSWSFTYAGAGSTLATLWRVDDKATAAVLGSFYTRLRGRASKSGALHHAKLAAVDSAQTAAEADPFYWAGLVLTGDERPLLLAGVEPPAHRQMWPWYALAGAGLLGAGAWWAARRGSIRA